MCLNQKTQKQNVLYFKRLENIYNFLLNCDIFFKNYLSKTNRKTNLFLYCLLEQKSDFILMMLNFQRKLIDFCFYFSITYRDEMKNSFYIENKVTYNGC